VQLDEVSKLAADLQHKVARGESDAILDLLGTTLSDLEYPLGALRWLADLTPEALEESIAAPGEIRRQLRPVQRAARHLVGLFDNLSFPDDLAPGVASEAQVLRVLAIGTTPPRAAHLIDRLRREGLHLQFRAGRSQEDILRAARAKEVDVLLVDHHLPAEQAESLREALQEASCPLPLVFVQEDSAALAKEIRRSTSSSEMVGSRDQVWRRLEELALRDSMTGVLNRRAFERFGTQEFDRAKRYDFPLSLAFFDLDYFKLVNDRLGHAAGDRMLQVFASYLLTATRQTDLVARLGGDEFAVLMSHTDGAGALILTQRLRDAVELHLREVLPPMDPLPGVSVGLAVFPGKDIQEFQGLLAAADQALYRAKRAGRGRLRAD